MARYGHFQTLFYCDSSLRLPDWRDSSHMIPHNSLSGTYFYHPNHLGSATWITNSSGQPIEYLHYMPYGELWLDQRKTAYSERFKFTGKERDSETGYDYFGARYYSSALPLWLSVDPLSDKYPNISPYAYCNGNPIKYIDINGNSFDEANEQIAHKIENYVALRIKQTDDGDRIHEFKKTLKDINSMRKDNSHDFHFIQNDSEEASKIGVNAYNSPTIMSIDNNSQKIGIFIDVKSLDTPFPDETIAHEVRHGGQIARGRLILEGNMQNYSYKHEIDAYRAQWSWSIGGLNIPTLLNMDGQRISNPFQINKTFINNIIDVNTGKLLYNFK